MENISVFSLFFASFLLSSSSFFSSPSYFSFLLFLLPPSSSFFFSNSLLFSSCPLPPQLESSYSSYSVLASGGEDNLIIVWDIGSGKRLHTFTGHKKSIWDLDFSMVFPSFFSLLLPLL